MVGTYKKTIEVDQEHYKFLKDNNKFLALALSEEKLKNKQNIEERTNMHKQYLDERGVLLNKYMELKNKFNHAVLQINQYKEFIERILDQSKHCLPSLTVFSGAVTEQIRICTEAKKLFQKCSELNLNDIENGGRHTSSQHKKTHTAKPMISGHVICRPTINIERLDVELSHFDLLPEVRSTPVNPVDELLSRDSDITDLLRNLSASSSEIEDNDYQNNDNEESLSLSVRRTTRLESIEEDRESPSPEITNSLRREARVVIDPLPPELNQSPAPLSQRGGDSGFHSTPSLKNKNYDPLEGPSSLLDDNGYVVNKPYFSKPRRNVKVDVISSSSSDTSDEYPTTFVNSKTSVGFVNSRKRRPPAPKRKFKTDENNDNMNSKGKSTNTISPKKKKIYSDISLNREPIVVLNKITIPDSDVSSNSSFNLSNGSLNNSENRISRNSGKVSYKERSLRCKLRR